MKPNLISHNRPHLDLSDIASVQKPLREGWVAHGPFSASLETRVAKYLGRRYACAVSSGTSALHLALLALGVNSKHEVILPTYVCTALLNAIHYVGAKPILVDIDPHNLGPSAADVRRKITRRTKAVIVNHTFGYAASISKIQSFGIPVIEDCAQALGSEKQGRMLGSFGDLATCSFYATKMMTSGYGGMVLTQNQSLYEKIRDLTQFDQRRDYKVRYNYSLSDILASVGLSQFSRLPDFLKKRRDTAAQYLKAIPSTSFYFWSGGVDEKPNFYRFILGTVKPFGKLVDAFRKQGVQVISPLAPYQLLHRYLGQNPKNFPVAEAVSRAVVSLPIYPGLSAAEIRKVCRAIQTVGA